jgi:hypothetical protein
MGPYDYQKEKSNLFTEHGSVLFVKVRDRVKEMIAFSGAITMGRAMSLPPGVGAADSWTLMACVDRMVELRELREVATNGRGQDRVFVSA